MFDERLLARALPRPAQDASSRALDEIMHLAQSAKYEIAAERAGELLDAGCKDVRAFVVYALGVFAERGPAAVPALFDSITGVLSCQGLRRRRRAAHDGHVAQVRLSHHEGAPRLRRTSIRGRAADLGRAPGARLRRRRPPREQRSSQGHPRDHRRASLRSGAGRRGSAPRRPISVGALRSSRRRGPASPNRASSRDGSRARRSSRRSRARSRSRPRRRHPSRAIVRSSSQRLRRRRRRPSPFRRPCGSSFASSRPSSTWSRAAAWRRRRSWRTTSGT